MIEFWFLLLAAIAFVTLVGHGIWVVIAAIIRGLNDQLEDGPRLKATCPVCGAVMAADRSTCARCDWSAGARFQDRPLRVGLRLLDRARERELLDEKTATRVRLALKNVAQPSEAAPPVLLQSRDTIGTSPATGISPIATEADHSDELQASEEPTATSDSRSPTSVDSGDLVADVGRRADRFARALTEPLAETTGVAADELPRAERRPWSELLSAFMQEKNIRWGEVVGGLLIVSCSIALVVSFWEHIATRPLLKFGIFTGVTASLFGLGLHASHRWKLPTTSQGVLMIAMMLVPLNFLALASFAEASELTPSTIVGEFVTLGVFFYLGYHAGRVLTPGFPWLTNLLVVVLAFYNLPIRRFIFTAPTGQTLYSVAAPMVAAYLATLWCLRHSKPRLSEKTEPVDVFTNQVWKLLGLASFALILAAGFLIVRTNELGGTIQRLSPLMMLAAAPSIVVGTIFWQTAKAGELRSLLLPATGVGLAGVGVMLAGIALSWPIPWLMIATCVLGALMCLALATRLELPQTHWLVAGLLSIAFAMGGLVLGGHLSAFESSGRAVLSQVSSVTTGLWYTGFSVLLVGGACGLRFISRPAIARSYAQAALGAGLIGAALITACGFGRTEHALSVSLAYGVYAVVFYLAALYFKPLPWGWLSGAALAAMCFQSIYFGGMHDTAILLRLLITLLAATTLYQAIAICERAVQPRQLNLTDLPFDSPFEIFSLAGCLITTLVACAAFTLLSPRPLPWAWAGISVLWIVSAWRYTDRALFATAQLAALATMTLAIDEYARTCDWYSTMRFGWLHPYSVEVQTAGLALFGATWVVVRRAISWWATSDVALTGNGNENVTLSAAAPAAPVHLTRAQRADWLTRAVTATVDEIATGLAVALLFAVCAYGALPGVLQELRPADTITNAAGVSELQGELVNRSVADPAQFEVLDIPHALIGSAATWWLFAWVTAVALLAVWERASTERLTLLVTAFAAAAYLVAMPGESSVAAASALRWSLGAFFLLGNALLWTPGRSVSMWLRDRSGKLEANDSEDTRVRTAWLGLVCAHALLPLAGMAASVAIVALQLEPPGNADWQLITWLAVIGVVGLGVLVGERRATRYSWLKDSSTRGTITVSTAILACMPLAAITLYLIGRSLAIHPVTGPDPESFFAQIGLAASYSVPILWIAAGLAGSAMALRSTSLALWAGIVLNLGGTAAYLLTLGAASFDIEHWLQLAQVNATISALYAVGWSGVRRWQTALADAPTSDLGLQTQTNVASGFLCIATAGVLSVLWWNPRLPLQLNEVAGPWGWLSVLSVAAALWVAARFVRSIPFPQYLPGLAIAVTALIGCLLHARLPRPWDASYAVLSLLTVSTVAVLLQMARARFRTANGTQLAADSLSAADVTVRTSRLYWWVCIVVWILILFAFRYLEIAARPWPTAIGLLTAAALVGVGGWIDIRWRSLWWSAVLVNLAFTIVWLIKSRAWQTAPRAPAIDFAHVNALAAALPTLAWVLIIRNWKTREGPEGPIRWGAVHRWMVPTSVGVVAILAMGWMVLALGGGTGFPQHILSLMTLSVVAFGCWACYWDDGVHWQSLGLYVTGVAGAVAVLQTLELSRELMIWSAPLVFGAYGLASCYLISRGQEFHDTLTRLRLLPRPTGETLSEGASQGGNAALIAAGCFLAAITVALAFFAQFRCEDQAFRVAASQSIMAQAVALALLTYRREESAAGIGNAGLRVASLGLGVVAAIANGWSSFDPSQWLPYERLTVVAIACSMMALFYGLGLVKLLPRRSRWIATAQQLMPWLLGISAAIVGVVMGLEIVSYLRFETQPPEFAIVGIAATLGIILLACLVAALVPGRDPLGLSEKTRVAYVYAAEFALLLFVIHIRISMPWLFRGFVQQIWPLLIMFIAFAGIGVSEWARRISTAQRQPAKDRLNLHLLVGPLEHTGAVLPLLPALGYWMLPSRVHYSLVMVVVGIAYGVLAQMKKSFGFSVLAALAANGSLWYLLHDNAIGLLAHPQVWLIPPALCVMVAAQLNKQRLAPEQLAAVRYSSSTVIYVSSTAEIFMTGVAEAPWLPLVLAGLSLIGIAVGIAAQIRAFLWLGLSFLLVAMMTIIWYAAVDLQQTWLWYVTGIVTGVIILAVFAVFEKRRNEVLHWVEKLKHWEA